MVVGHTKNDADRFFNILTLRYRSENVYSMDMLTDVLSASDDVKIHRVNPSTDFLEIDTFLGGFYRRYPKIDGYHIFSCAKNDCNKKQLWVTCSEGDMQNATSKKCDMMKKQQIPGRERFMSYSHFLDHRKSVITSHPIKHIEIQPMNPYKRVELYKNYRKLIPVMYRDELCPKPPQWVFNHVEKEKKRKIDSKKRKADDIKDEMNKKK